LLNSLSATGLLIDILGALLIALVVLNTASKSILRNSAAHMGYNYDHSISQITQRNDTILGICLIIVGFSLQFLEALGYVANFFSKTIFISTIVISASYFFLRHALAAYQINVLIPKHGSPKKPLGYPIVEQVFFSNGLRSNSGKTIPVLTVIAVIVAIWYACVVWMNAPFEYDKAERAKTDPPNFSQLISNTMAQERPVLPAAHQVFAEIWDTTVNKKITSKRSLIYHSWITLSATLLGFIIGTVLGILLAVGIVHNRAMDRSVMPWVIASQTIPILAVAPMIIVTLNAVGLTGLIPKALISTYLSFFPVVVGMVKGLRSPDNSQLDLLHTWYASKPQIFWKLRWPSSMPFLFTSLKVAVAISLVGAIVGELPTGAVAGLGARLLAGSYYGQTIQIWSALFMAAALAAVLVMIVGFAHSYVLKRMGQKVEIY